VRRALAVALAIGGCGDNTEATIRIASDPQWQPALAELAALTPYAVTLEPGDGFHIDVVDDPALPAEAYALEAAGEDRIAVRAHDVLGAQYGTAAALEALGFRFRHPFDPYVPARPAVGAIDTAVHAPEMRVRGLQLHTLHPIEGYFALWEPSVESALEARRIVDWLIKNRGNFLQWVALEDILSPAHRDAWRVFTAELIEYAHARGVRTGLNIQLFGQSNLQLAFDLSDDRTGTVPIADEIAARLPIVTEGVPFDVYDLSFGEFFNADPQQFIDAVDEVRRQLRTAAPQAEMHAVVHVGETQRVTYNGEELLYYFLVKYADPSIVPDIHTVMFYDLFEPADGAYHHADFAEHRDYLAQRICAGQPVAYFPETAYWVAFDNSVPQFFPLYVRNRWLDLARLRSDVPCGRLDTHLLFSSGWEWGYWLNDVTALRASYELPATPDALIEHALGPELTAAAPVVGALIDVQRARLMGDKLVPYLAGRDAVIDAGRTLDIVSQPDRVTFADLAAGADRAALATAILEPLEAYAGKLAAIGERYGALDLPAGRWADELGDGLAIDYLRSRFVLATYRGAIAHLDGDDAASRSELARARDILSTADAIVLRRHADLHDARGERLIGRTPNETFYQFGYLRMADTLCYWVRELVEVERLAGLTPETPPGCIF
jgi:hypothetical protein